MTIKDFLEKIKNIISKEKQISLAYIFGSFLNFKDFNDIDIGIVILELSNPYDDAKFALNMARILEKEIDYQYSLDIKILNKSPIDFQYNVIKNGKILYLRNEQERISYEKKVVSLYLDYQDMYFWHQKQIIERN